MVIKATARTVAAVRWRTEDRSSALTVIIPAPVATRVARPGDRSLEALVLPDVALATCSLLPDLDADERMLIPALAAHGLTAEPRVWDDAGVRWDEFRLVVVRSTWDYAARRDAFLTWAASLPRVLNPVDVLTWNTDKTYLRTLAASGVPTVPTTWIGPDANDGLSRLPGGQPRREARGVVGCPEHCSIRAC